MPRALSFKGDPKPKKRKRTHDTDSIPESGDPASRALDQRTGNTPDTDAETAWTTADQVPDLTGPTLLVLPAPVASLLDVDPGDADKDTKETQDDEKLRTVCIATDAGGKVFASAIENMVEGAPGSSEPHDVRQVWVARRVDGDTVCFKGFHGRFLSADKYGIPTATREAISAEETFTLVPCSDTANTATPRFRLKTCWGTFLGRQADKTGTAIRGDLEVHEDTAVEVNAEVTNTASQPAGQDGAKPGRTVTKHKAPGSELIIRIQQKHKIRAAQTNDSKREGDKVSRAQIRADLGKRGEKLEEEDIRALKRAAKEGRYHEALLDYRAKGAHDKFA